MSDILSVGATIVLFALSLLYIRACEGLTRKRTT